MRMRERVERCAKELSYCVKTHIFSVFPNLHTYWRETPRQRTNNEYRWWKKSGMDGNWTCCGIASLPSVRLFQSAAAGCEPFSSPRLLLTAGGTPFPLPLLSPTEESVLNLLNVSERRKKKIFIISRLTYRRLNWESFLFLAEKHSDQ